MQSNPAVTVRGVDQEQTLIERIGDAEVALNIRAHARFTDRVLAACPPCAASPSGARAPITWSPARPVASPSPTPPASTPMP